MLFRNALAVALLSLSASPAVSASSSRVEASTVNKYARAHALDTNTFDPRDGWISLNFTNEPYKYRSDSESEGGDTEGGLSKRGKKAKGKSLGGVIGSTVNGIFKGLLGFGKPGPVTVTWCVELAYTATFNPVLNTFVVLGILEKTLRILAVGQMSIGHHQYAVLPFPTN